MKRILFVVGLALILTACGGGQSSPAAPSPTPTATPTRIIGLSGNMAFGNIQTGSSFDAVLRITNSGNSTLTITGMTGPSGYAASWTSGTISAGGFQESTVRFSPAAETTYNGTLTVSGDHTSGTNTIAVSGTGTRPPGPRTSFGSGQYLIGSDIVAGRYYSAPQSNCYWERESGLGGTLGEILANDFTGFAAGQWIVDILSTDKAFKTESGCGTWSMTPRSAPAAGTITQGMWLVGGQISSGTYRANAQYGCYWERLRNFQGTLAAIVANDFVGTAGQQLVSISGADAGFDANDSCGTWTRISSIAAPQTLIQSPADISTQRARAGKR